MNRDVDQYLEFVYNKALEKYAADRPSALEEVVCNDIATIVKNAENAKAVVAVVLTSAIYKALNPEQDIRRHQASIEGGYGGRPFDTKYITPFLKRHDFPSMAESGWLTRSLEQKVPYDEHYTGAIRPVSLKMAFLNIIKAIETLGKSEEIAVNIVSALIEQRDEKVIDIARPRNLSINDIVGLLNKHFNHKYSVRGASRLPTLAIYAIYMALIQQLKRFEGKRLLPLASHTSADAQSGRLGDIDVVNEDGSSFEVVEVKFDIPITHNIVCEAKRKIQPSTVNRYYILSTHKIEDKDISTIESDVSQIKNVHGCQVIVNGIIPTIKYYLRLLDDASLFVENYASLLSKDNDIKFEHKAEWNNLVSGL